MTTTLVKNKKEWAALVMQWIEGVGALDDKIRTTATQFELLETLRVGFADDDKHIKAMHPYTLRYINYVAENGIQPEEYPCVVVYRFDTIPNTDEGAMIYLGGDVQFVTISGKGSPSF
jgi:hypothetical protein